MRAHACTPLNHHTCTQTLPPSDTRTGAQPGLNTKPLPHPFAEVGGKGWGLRALFLLPPSGPCSPRSRVPVGFEARPAPQPGLRNEWREGGWEAWSRIVLILSPYINPFFASGLLQSPAVGEPPGPPEGCGGEARGGGSGWGPPCLLSRSGPAARPRLALTSSTPRRGQAPRPSAGGAEAAPACPGQMQGRLGASDLAPLRSLGWPPRLAPPPPYRGGGGQASQPVAAGGAHKQGGGRMEEGGGGARPEERKGRGREAARRWGRAGPSSGAGSPASWGAADAARSGCAGTPRFPLKVASVGAGSVAPPWGCPGLSGRAPLGSLSSSLAAPPSALPLPQAPPVVTSAAHL